MSSKCEKCSTDLKQGELIAKCSNCNSEFHPACTPLGLQIPTKTKLKNYKCESCIMESHSSISQRSNDSSAVDKRTLLEALNSFKMDLKKHTDAGVGNVITKLDTIKDEVQTLNSKFNALEQNQHTIKGRCDTLERTNAALVDELRSLQVRLNDAEQYSRSANIEIVGIPETSGENIYNVLQKLATVLGITYKRENVTTAHRLRLFSKNHAHPPIIAQFVYRSDKEQWLKASKTLRNIKSTDISTNLQLCNVYINEHLTPNNKGLLGRARGMQRNGKIHFAGYFNGKILIKPRERDAAIRIYHQVDLDKYD